MSDGFFEEREQTRTLRNGGTMTWRGRALMKAYRKATKESVQAAVKHLKREIKAATPRSRKHRSDRRYPNRGGGLGRKYHEPKRLHTTIYSRVRDRGDRGILGFVSFQYGYINLLLGHLKKTGQGNFMIDARDRNARVMLQMLRGKARTITVNFTRKPARMRQRDAA